MAKPTGPEQKKQVADELEARIRAADRDLYHKVKRFESSAIHFAVAQRPVSELILRKHQRARLNLYRRLASLILLPEVPEENNPDAH